MVRRNKSRGQGTRLESQGGALPRNSKATQYTSGALEARSAALHGQGKHVSALLAVSFATLCFATLLMLISSLPAHLISSAEFTCDNDNNVCQRPGLTGMSEGVMTPRKKSV